MLDIAAGLLAVLGSGLALAAAIGTVRLPNFLARTHAASIAGSVGAGLILFAVALLAPSAGHAVRAIGAVLFLFLTAPLAAHLLAKASYRVDESADASEASPEGRAPDATK